MLKKLILWLFKKNEHLKDDVFLHLLDGREIVGNFNVEGKEIHIPDNVVLYGVNIENCKIFLDKPLKPKKQITLYGNWVD